MENTTNLKMPFIASNQAQKHITHNQALQVLDALVMLSIVSRSNSAPPESPAEGERHIVAATATDEWTGQEDRIACFQSGSWVFFTPQEGWRGWCEDEASLLVWSESSWQLVTSSGGGGGEVTELGVNTTADTTNRLAVSSPATLLTHEGDDHRLVINKNALADTASLVFQNGYSGRAELGLSGNDALSFKVSADGSIFNEALRFDPETAKPSFPTANFLEDFAVNLYQDSGRFAGNGASDSTIGSFSFPSYFSLYNGAAAAGYGKFISNNDDYGGAAGTLAAHVKTLVDKIRDASYRRYGNEFWVSQITAGGGTAASYAVGGTTYYYCCYASFKIRPPKMTFHAYVKAVDATFALRLYDGQTAFVGGIQHSESFEITVADGWKSLTIFDAQDPYSSYGYNPQPFLLYALSGKKVLLACPALMGGLTKVDDNVGVIAASNSWPG